MNIKIDTTKYDVFRGIHTYKEIAEKVNSEFGTSYQLNAISRAFRGLSKSYKLHTLICNVLDLQISEVYKIEK